MFGLGFGLVAWWTDRDEAWAVRYRGGGVRRMGWRVPEWVGRNFAQPLG
jgi:hypothetical protein